MTAVIIGSIGFLCCFLYDHNSIRLKKSFLHPFFSIGCFLIAVSTGLVIRNCWPRRGFYFCLAGFLGSGKALGAFVVLIVWNILYIFYQDRIVFPETFSNYGAYQQTTPFLIPDRNSTAACIKTWRKGGKRR